MTRLRYFSVCMGCDPEFFFSKKGNIYGAEKIIPISGLIPQRQLYTTNPSKVTIDGVQAEINPIPSTCREGLAGQISVCFKEIYNVIKEKEGNNLNIDLSQVVTMRKSELKTLSEQARVLGCEPSKNIYDEAESQIKVNASTYLKRSAGGHIHLGTSGDSTMTKTLRDMTRTVTMLDIILGNTAVLVDKNPSNMERRKVYGKAGEFRKTSYGLEYRTLSNFWLKAYPLMSFVMGMARLAVTIVANTYYDGSSMEKEILEATDLNRIRKAINKNDYNLAYKNFKKLEPILKDYIEDSSSFSLNSNNLEDFRYFISKDLTYWFKDDPIHHWMNHNSSNRVGWERFLAGTVRNERLATK